MARAIAARMARAGIGPDAGVRERRTAEARPTGFVFDHRFRDEMLLAADLALVASGAATLEVAYRATTMIVMYNHGRWFIPIVKWIFRMLGKRFLLTPYLSLPNIIAGREIVPEFMPYYNSI